MDVKSSARTRQRARARLTAAALDRRAAAERGVAAPAARQIGAKIAGWRRRRGMTQAALAATVRCDRSVVCRWEAGLRTPTLGHLLALGRALGCGAAALLPHEGDG